MSTKTTKIYIKSGKKTLTIPVLPEKIEWSDSANHSSVNVNKGEIQLRQGRKARTVSFSSFFPSSAFRGSVSKVKKPSYYVKTIRQWINDEDVVRIVLTRNSSNYLGMSMKALITDFKYYEEGADVGTIQYSITFKEYRKVSASKIHKKKSGSKKRKGI